MIKYFRARQIEYGGEKYSIEYLEVNEPELYQKIVEFYNTLDRESQITLYTAIAEEILKPIGGLWKKDEVIEFGKDAEKAEELFYELFQDLSGDSEQK